MNQVENTQNLYAKDNKLHNYKLIANIKSFYRQGKKGIKMICCCEKVEKNVMQEKKVLGSFTNR